MSADPDDEAIVLSQSRFTRHQNDERRVSLRENSESALLTSRKMKRSSGIESIRNISQESSTKPESELLVSFFKCLSYLFIRNLYAQTELRVAFKQLEASDISESFSPLRTMSTLSYTHLISVQKLITQFNFYVQARRFLEPSVPEKLQVMTLSILINICLLTFFCTFSIVFPSYT